MCYQNQKYSKTTHLSSRTFAMGIKDGSWPACNRVKHLSVTMSTFEQKKEELKSPDKTKEQMKSPDVYKSSRHPPLHAACAAFAQQVTPLPGSATAVPFPLRASKETDVLPEIRRALENSQPRFLAQPTVSGMNRKHNSGSCSALDAAVPLEYNRHPAQLGSRAARLCLQH